MRAENNSTRFGDQPRLWRNAGKTDEQGAHDRPAMRVEEKFLSICKIVVRLSILDQCSLQNDVGIGKRVSSRVAITTS